MRSNFLPVKLRRPRLHRVYPRKRLFSLLSANEKYAAVWVTGPAGSGKTTLINSYLETQERPCLWYTIDEGDFDIASFFYYLRLSLGPLCLPGKELPPLFTPDYFPHIALFSERFFRKYFALFTSPFALVLDDYQQVDPKSQLHEVLGHAVSQAHEKIKLFLLSRKEPCADSVFPVDGNCYHLSPDKLKLAPQEALAVARTVSGQTLSAHDAADLHQKTDGWMAGLILLLKRGALDGIEPEHLSRQAPQEIFDYLNGELFGKLPLSIRTQMCRLAFLPTISIESAQKITGDKEIETLLAHLNLDNAFVDKIAGQGASYRFHPLMRAFLQMTARRTLAPDELKMLLAKSAATLAEEAYFEEAVQLYLKAHAPSAAADLILSQAPDLAGQGRFGTLQRLLTQLSGEVMENSPWLLYWHSLCQLPMITDDNEETLPKHAPLQRFLRAFEIFKGVEDKVGTYMVLSGALAYILFKFEKFTDLDPWIEKYDELCAKWGPLCPFEVIPWLAPVLLQALLLRRPGHPLLPEWVQIGTKLIDTKTNLTVTRGRHILGPLIDRHIQMRQYHVAEKLIHIVQRHVQENPSPNFTLLYFHAYSLYCFHIARFETSVRIAEEAYQFEKKFGIRSRLPQWFGALAAIYLGNRKLAEEILHRTKPGLSEYGQWHTIFYHGLAAKLAFLQKDFQPAKSHIVEKLNLLQKTGRTGAPLTQTHLFCAVIHHGCGEVEIAYGYLKKAFASLRSFYSPTLLFECRLVEAFFAFAGNDQERFDRVLTLAFKTGRKHKILFEHMATFHHSPHDTAILCAEALKRGIEVAYVRKLIRACNLMPSGPSYDLAQWPWKFKIKTLGGFEVEGDELLVEGDDPSVRKPLSLLKYLISKGGRGVFDAHLQDDLWPAAEGDRAAVNFKSSLYKLRKQVVEKEMIVVNAGRLYLNEQLCWIDLWAFEDICKEAELQLSGHLPARRAQALLAQMEKLYRGSFLPDETAPWADRKRRELSRRFEDLAERLSHITETADLKRV